LKRRYLSGELQLPCDNSLSTPKQAELSSLTRIVELTNMVTAADLESNQDYEDIMEDTKEECCQFGSLKSVIIPRSGNEKMKVFLEYTSVEDATKAIKSLSGRSFDGRKVIASYVDEESFKKIVPN